MNTLILPDTHIPFHHPNLLPWVREIAHDYKVKRVCHVGDIVDNHAISFHDHDPDGMSPGDELIAARKELTRWVKAFPNVHCAVGNHDELGRRKAYDTGIPTAYYKSFADVLGLPSTWLFRFNWLFDGNWQLTHGTGSSGHDAAFKLAMNHRISTAAGHIHTAAGVKFHASNKDIIWSLQVGCGIDRKSYAFSYGRDFITKPILGCGLVLEGGKLPIFLPMPL